MKALSIAKVLLTAAIIAFTNASSPTLSPTLAPLDIYIDDVVGPTRSPTRSPSRSPTSVPTKFPTPSPTPIPTTIPTNAPTVTQTNPPSTYPSPKPSTNSPSTRPSFFPTRAPVIIDFVVNIQFLITLVNVSAADLQADLTASTSFQSSVTQQLLSNNIPIMSIDVTLPTSNSAVLNSEESTRPMKFSGKEFGNQLLRVSTRDGSGIYKQGRMLFSSCTLSCSIFIAQDATSYSSSSSLAAAVEATIISSLSSRSLLSSLANSGSPAFRGVSGGSAFGFTLIVLVPTFAPTFRSGEEKFIKDNTKGIIAVAVIVGIIIVGSILNHVYFVFIRKEKPPAPPPRQLEWLQKVPTEPFGKSEELWPEVSTGRARVELRGSQSQVDKVPEEVL